jgi:inhibitor of Bruton tyrosine kinase
VAWSSAAPQALSNKSHPSHALSFQAIQEQQASKPPPKGPPKSLRQIQDEEQEAAFLTWFEEESARIQKQEAALLAGVMAEEQPKGQHGRGDKSGHVKRPRGEQGGRGRGRGRERRGKEHPSSSALVS